MFKGKEVLLWTGARYYSEDKTKCNSNIEKITTNPHFIVDGSYRSWGFGGFWIEKSKNGKLAIEFYNINNLFAKDGKAIHIFSPRYKRDTGSYYNSQSNEERPLCRIDFDKNGIDITGFDKNVNLLSNIHRYFNQQFQDYRCYLWGNQSLITDLRANVWSPKSNGYFCKETLEILKEAGFPEEVFYKTTRKTQLNQLWVLDSYFRVKQTPKQLSKNSNKIMEYFNGINDIDVKVTENELILSDGQIRLFFSLKQGVKIFRYDQEKGWFLLRETPNYRFGSTLADKIVDQANKNKVLSYFVDFIKNHKNGLFNSSDYYCSNFEPFIEFLRDLGRGNARIIENLLKHNKLTADTVFKCDSRYHLDNDFKKLINNKKWDLLHQLKMNRNQLAYFEEAIKTKTENSCRFSYDHDFQEIYVVLHQMLNRAIWHSSWDDELDKDYDYSLNSFTEIKDNTFKWIIDFLFSQKPKNAGRWGSYCDCDPFRDLPKTAFPGLNQEQYFALIEKFWRLAEKHFANQPLKDLKDYYYTAMRAYKDYLNMRSCIANLDIFDAEHFPLLPDSFGKISKLHDELVEYQNKEKIAIQKAKIKKYFDATQKLAEKWYYEDDNYNISLVRDPMELRTEGDVLHHCVGGYVDDVTEQRTYILFLRRKSTPTVPFVTINVNANKNDIIQIHGLQNAWLGNWPDAVPTVMRWLKKNKINCSDQILLSTAKGYYGGGATLIEKPEI